jgi:WD40 repeat protein
VFATIDASGEVSLWNLNADVEIPISREHISDHGLNCLQWSPDGKRLIVGDTEGVLYLIELPESVCCWHQPLTKQQHQCNTTANRFACV